MHGFKILLGLLVHGGHLTVAARGNPGAVGEHADALLAEKFTAYGGVVELLLTGLEFDGERTVLTLHQAGAEGSDIIAELVLGHALVKRLKTDSAVDLVGDTADGLLRTLERAVSALGDAIHHAGHGPEGHVAVLNVLSALIEGTVGTVEEENHVTVGNLLRAFTLDEHGDASDGMAALEIHADGLAALER